MDEERYQSIGMKLRYWKWRQKGFSSEMDYTSCMDRASKSLYVTMMKGIPRHKS